MNQKLALLLVIFLSLGLLSCSSGDNDPGGETPPEQFTRRYNANQSFYSKILGQEMKYAVLLPQEYLSDLDSRYGVVYLLHGWGGNDNSWGPSGLNIQIIADRQEKAGGVRPLIYIMPHGANSYFSNRYDGNFNYMDMLINELIPLIDKRFRTTGSGLERGIAGFSMGGFGALNIASQYPDKFSVSVGLSPSLNTDEQYCTLSQDGWNLQWGSVFGGVGSTGTGRLTAYYKSQCPLHFFETQEPMAFQNVRYYIDCGDDEERLYAGNGALHSLLRDRNIKHEYRVRNGAHTDSYWSESMNEALPFIEHSFKKSSYPQETPKTFPTEIHSVRNTIKAGNSDLELWIPVDYNPDLTYKVLYYSKGEGNAELTTKHVAIALDSLMQIKKLIIAGFDIKSVLQDKTDFSSITEAVENVINTEKNSKSRLGLAYGSDADYLYNCTRGQVSQIDYFFAEDAVINNPATNNFAKLYYLDITDEGSHYKSMFNLFSHLREENATVQYRVRNGINTVSSAQTGIYSMSYFISECLTKK